MEIRSLRYFLAVCEEKNFSRAAKKMLISQPALSKQIKELENQLGVQLFIRAHRQVRLTEAGYFLRDRAKEMLILNDDTENTLQRNKVLSGVLRVGAGESPNIAPVLQTLGEIARDNKNVRVQLEDGNADAIEAKVNNGALDFGIIMRERDLSNFNYLRLKKKNHFVAYFQSSLPLAQKKVVTIKDLSHYPLIVSNQSNSNAWAHNSKIKLNVIAEYNLPYNALIMTKKIGAVLIAYENYLPNDLKDDLIMRPLVPNCSEDNTLIWKKNIKLSHLCTYFINTVRHNWDLA